MLANVKKFICIIDPSIEAEKQNEENGAGSLSSKGWSRPLDMTPLMNWLTYDIMGDLVFGKRFNCLESDDHRNMPVLMTEGTKFGYWVS